MNPSPRPKGHKLKGNKRPKVRKNRKGGKKPPSWAGERSLIQEVTSIWNRRVPREAQEAIWPLVLDGVSLCLSSYTSADLTAAVQKVVAEKDLKALVDLKRQVSSPQMHGDGHRYLAMATVVNLFAKIERSIKGLNPLAQGEKRFREAEMLCRISNKRLAHYRNFDFANRPLMQRLPVHEVFHLARRKIQAWLGPVGESIPKMVARHGPGGVVGLKRPTTTPYYKFAKAGYSCSGGAYWYAVRAIASSDAWIRALAISEGLISEEHSVSCIPYETRLRLADANITIADHNKVTFVPKDATTKRSISVEPHMNVYIQLGVGEFLKGVLRRVGCDLKDQTRNQSLAYVGSIQHDEYDPVTLDLRMASDTVSIEIVRELLPTDWFEFLDDLRSHHGSYRGESWRWAKFSSMGNGFTFELESLLFLALSQACSDHNGTTEWFQSTFGPAYKYAYVSVYGDDIIVPRRDSDLLIRILRFCGFQLNLDKSFVQGPFRESCGQDYWNGVDVRPFYFKRGLSHVRDLIHLHNGLKWVGQKIGPDVLADVCGLIRSLIPGSLEAHLRGVEPTIGDEYIWVTPDEAHRSKLVVWHASWQKWTFPKMGLKPHTKDGQLHWRYVQFLYGHTHHQVLLDYGGFDRRRDDNPLKTHFHAGGSLGDVVESGGGAPILRWG